MVYLIPKGGLCNRMRAIDSMLSICARENEDLTIFWRKNKMINCNYEDIFLPLKHDKVNIKLINLPFMALSYLPRVYFSIFQPKKNYFSSQYFTDTFDAHTFVQSMTTIDEADKIFHKRIEPRLETAFNQKKKSLLFESGFRFSNVDSESYSKFLPTKDIDDKVQAKVGEFQHTIGFHVRRTDHTFSKMMSTDDKVKELMDGILKENPESSFFLATDSETIKENLIQEYGSKIIINPSIPLKRNSVEGMQAAMLDLYCLAHTQKVYGSYMSTFNLVAAQIGKIEREVIF